MRRTRWHTIQAILISTMLFASCAQEDGLPTASSPTEPPATTEVTGSGTPDADGTNPSSSTDTIVRTLAGDAGPGSIGEPGYQDGPAQTARFGDPAGIALGPQGDIFIADATNNVIRRIDPSGDVSTFAGTGEEGALNGPSQSATFNGPTNVAVAEDGSLFVADTLNHQIRRIDPQGTVSTVAGSGEPGMGNGSFRDGPGNEARFSMPTALAIGTSGELYVGDTGNRRVRLIRDGIVSTFAGSGMLGTQDGPAADASLGFIVGLAIAPNGELFMADQPSSSIRKVTTSGMVETVAKSGLTYPSGISFALDGDLIVSDTSGFRLVQVDVTTGVVDVVAGTGVRGYRDGVASASQFAGPTGLSVTDDGSIIVSDGPNCLIRVVEGAA